jgi:putative tricarboxylic transport membrane protein
MEQLIAVVGGILFGTAVGMLPGLGMTSGLIVLSPWLLGFDAMQLLLFYGCMATMTHYVGSVVGIRFGVPGEPTSLIASRVGFRLANRGHGTMAIGLCATGSFAAALLSLMIIAIGMQAMMATTWIYSVRLQFVLLILVITALLFYRSNSMANNLIQITCGFLLGCVGYNSLGTWSITFGQPWLLPGLNTMLVLTLLFVTPNLIMNRWKTHAARNATGADVRPWPMIWRYRYSWLRGTGVGLIAGIIPGAGVSISSNLAASLEQRLRRPSSQILLSAESANNSAGMTSLLPMLIFGVAILPSEAFLLDMISTQQVNINMAWLVQPYVYDISRLHWILITLLIANCVALVISWQGANLISRIYAAVPWWVMTFSILCLLASVIAWQSWQNLRWSLDVITLLALIPATWFIVRQRIDTLPLMFVFLLADPIQRNFSTILSYL